MASEAIMVVSADPTPLHVAGEPHPASVTAQNILPLIIDVVRAAEIEDSITHPEALGRPRGPIRPALTALEKALDG